MPQQAQGPHGFDGGNLENSLLALERPIAEPRACVPPVKGVRLWAHLDRARRKHHKRLHVIREFAHISLLVLLLLVALAALDT